MGTYKISIVSQNIRIRAIISRAGKTGKEELDREESSRTSTEQEFPHLVVLTGS
ncbi:hypothetical protein J6590_095064, partial [Homalodisca vitripennis]